MTREHERDEGYRGLLARYHRDLEAPGSEMKDAVMAALQARDTHHRRGSLLRRLLRPREVRVAPLLAAAALVFVIGLSALVTGLVVRDGGVASDRTAPDAVLVHFELSAPRAARVALAGTFNGWSDSTTYFVRNPESGRWRVTVTLTPGQHEYLFVIDGERWIPDPDAHAQVDDGFGNVNSMIVVGPRGVVRS